MGKKKCKKIVLIKGSEVGFDKLEIKKMNNTELLNILKSIYIYFKAKTRQKIKNQNYKEVFENIKEELCLRKKKLLNFSDNNNFYSNKIENQKNYSKKDIFDISNKYKEEKINIFYPPTYKKNLINYNNNLNNNNNLINNNNNTNNNDNNGNKNNNINNNNINNNNNNNYNTNNNINNNNTKTQKFLIPDFLNDKYNFNNDKIEKASTSTFYSNNNNEKGNILNEDLIKTNNNLENSKIIYKKEPEENSIEGEESEIFFPKYKKDLFEINFSEDESIFFGYNEMFHSNIEN